MANYYSWVIPLIGTICIAVVPVLFRVCSLLAVLVERVDSNKTSLASEQAARMAADAEQCRRLNDIEDALEGQGNMLGRIDERTGWIVTGLQRAGVVDISPQTERTRHVS